MRCSFLELICSVLGLVLLRTALEAAIVVVQSWSMRVEPAMRLGSSVSHLGDRRDHRHAKLLQVS